MADLSFGTDSNIDNGFVFENRRFGAFAPAQVSVEVCNPRPEGSSIVYIPLTKAFRHAFDKTDVGLVGIRMSRLSTDGLRPIAAEGGPGIPADMDRPLCATTGGRNSDGRVEGLESTSQLRRGAAENFITINVPTSASVIL